MIRDKNITSKIMRSVKSKDTKPEKILAKVMWLSGLRYRKHYKIVGRPDFVFIKKKVAVFCDGDFWHGNNWKIRRMSSLLEELSGYSLFWKEKILKNIERDKKVNQELKSLGWNVIRLWESDIKKNPNKCLEYIKKRLKDINPLRD